MSTWPEVVANVSEKPAKNSRTFRGQSGEERKQERRKRLIEAGVLAFGSRSYHDVTVREVCAGAKLTERYFYESFQNMPALFMEVFAEVNLTLKNAVLRAIMFAPREPLALAEAYLRAYFTFIREDPKRARIVGFAALEVNQQVRQFVERAIEDYANTVRSFMMLLYPAASNDPRFTMDLLSYGIVGSNTYIAERWIAENFKTPIEVVVSTNLLLFRSIAEQVKWPLPSKG
jgi:AcrR family transcriptional regulator